MKNTGGDPAEKVEEGIRDMPQFILHVVAADPEEKHVPKKMENVGMKEHA